jgi:uncharacterized protein (DUF1015 family)
MATISPFRAWRYAPERVPLEKVVTQPYDNITPAMQEAYYQADLHNLVRIILGKRFSGDDARENVYTRAASSFRDWRQTGVLRQDAEPSLYLYRQRFAVPASGQTVARQGFIGIGKLEEYSARVVFRHEQTLAKPKADRLDLLRATRAHFGQIFMLYSGKGAVDAVLEAKAAGAPLIAVTDDYGVEHRVWGISDAGAIASVQQQMSDRKLIIADGHHRYETALAYRNEMRQARQEDAPAASDHVMMTFIDMDRPGLVVLPTHRVVRGVAARTLENFAAEARRFFNVEEADAGIDAVRAAGMLRHAGRAGTAILAVLADRAWLLHTPKGIGGPLFSGFSLRQQALDVVQLHKCLLESCLRISEEAIRDQTNVGYFREAGDALGEVRAGRAQAAFLMNPVRIEQVRDIALSGDVLPQKSTDFFPKLLSGLTIYGLE